RLAVFSSGSLAFLLELLFATKAQVGFACAEQSLGVLAIHFEPLGLPIGTKRTPNVGPFIPIETQPIQIGDELVFKTRFTPVDVGVLDAQNHRPAVLSGKKPVKQGGAGIADVKMPCRRGCKAHAHTGRISHGTMVAFALAWPDGDSALVEKHSSVI